MYSMFSFVLLKANTMHSSSKKTPATTGRKKVMASSRAESSIKRQRKTTAGQNGFYIQDPVDTVKHTVTSSSTRIYGMSHIDTILTILQEMQQANKDVVQRIVTLEKNQSISSTSMASTPGSQNQVHTDLSDSHASTGKQPNMFQLEGSESGSNQVSSHNILGLGVRPRINNQ